MSIELSRAAYYEGEGLPEPVEVWRGRLDDRTEVFFTHPYDQASKGDVATTAMTVTERPDEGGTAYRYEFLPRNGELTWEYRAMLGHAAIFPADGTGAIRPRADAASFEGQETTGAILRSAQIYRARYLPAETPADQA